MVVFPICYFPPIPWYVAFLREKEVSLEVCQHYRKQEYTSRTIVKVANRILPLSIPVGKRGAKVPIKDKKISYAENWQIQHWRSIQSAYKNSPFFEFYEEEIHTCLMQKSDYLLDLLTSSLDLSNRLLGVSAKTILTKEYKETGRYSRDYRGVFDASLAAFPRWFKPRPYPQVFGEFQAGLSVLDLIFNLGPESKAYLLDSYEDDSAYI